MIETTQILLISAITVMTIILTVIGIQLIFVLKELRKFLGRTNLIIDEFEKIGVSFNHGFSEILGFFLGLKNLLAITDLLAKKHNKKNEK